jgi:tRNA threonylcarbamoyladenosine modification (KEOPS) complex  Pcc1 subunit
MILLRVLRKLSVNNQLVESSILIKYPTSDIAQTILNAVNPDNFQAPKGLRIAMTSSDNMIMINVNSSKGIGNLLNTLDDLLECISAAEKVLNRLS